MPLPKQKYPDMKTPQNVYKTAQDQWRSKFRVTSGNRENFEAVLGEIVSERDSMKRQVPKGFDESGPGWIVKLDKPDAENYDNK